MASAGTYLMFLGFVNNNPMAKCVYLQERDTDRSPMQPVLPHDQKKKKLKERRAMKRRKTIKQANAWLQ